MEFAAERSRRTSSSRHAVDHGERHRTGSPARNPIGLLHMQRAAGNSAVCALLSGPTVQRDGLDGDTAGPPEAGAVERPGGTPVRPPRPGDTADMDRAITEHLGINEFTDAARILNGFTEADIDVRITRYTEAQRTGLHAAAVVNGSAAVRIRGPIDLARQVRSGEWPAAAHTLEDYPDGAERVPDNLRRLGWWEGVHLLQAAEAAHLPVAARIRVVVAERSADIAAALPGRAVDPPVAARMLNALNGTDLPAAVAPLTAPQLFDINTAATREGIHRVVVHLGREPQAGLIRVEGFDRQLRDAIARSDWPAVAGVLGRYPDDTARRQRLQWFHLPQVTALADTLRSGGGPLYPLVEARRVEKLGQDYEAAISQAVGSPAQADRWDRVVRLLGAYNDADLAARAQRVQAVGGPTAVTAAQAASQRVFGDDTHRVRRILLYTARQAQAGAPARPADPQPFATGGAGPAVAVPGGSVTTYSQVAPGTGAGTGTPDWYALDYQGAQAEQTGWLQFISREMERFDTGGASLGYFVPTSGLVHQGQPGNVEYSRPGAEHWYIDTFSNSFPFYESPVTAGAPAGFSPAGTRGGHSTTPSTPASPAGRTMMVDRPGSVATQVAEAFAPVRSGGLWGVGGTSTPVGRVEHRVRFHDYLVRGNQVLYENTMTVVFSYTAAPAPGAPDPPRVNVPGNGAAASRLRPEHFRALVHRFPAWGFYPQ
ncbi:hypothetical protein DFJ66_8017 [Saccharothrix variisporea]|uniref:Uncharacterized protein n=1 Tax=Saccharothrix variisporea TaxID=543527 RepID=A0A495XJQ1_9PSEU|nr:hypothetical protein DFJ66_8017 [Saccharothrix variisporea]